MADGVIIPATGSGTATPVVATDDAGAAGHVQVVKLAISTDGSATALTANNTDGMLSNPSDRALRDLGKVDIAAFDADCTVIGKAAHDAAVSGNPVLVGIEARDTLGTAVATGDVVRAASDRYGNVRVTGPVATHVSSNGTPITATTTSIIAAPAAGNHLRVHRIHLSNGGATATWVAVRDGAGGTQHYRSYLPQGGLISLNLASSGALDLTTATRLDIVLSATGSVEYEIDYLVVAD